MQEAERKYIEAEMSKILRPKQMKKLIEVLEGLQNKKKQEDQSNEELLRLFLTAKKVEGCSRRTTKFYGYMLQKFISKQTKSLVELSTDDIRDYLSQCESNSNVSKVSIDNIRRILSTFFSWLEEEDYIRKSPIKRIHKIKAPKTIKEPFSDEMVERIKDECKTQRDLAIVELLNSTGMRVGELVRLNKNQVDFGKKEIIVFGKGNKERRVYFDAKTKIHLIQYLEAREDTSEALFVSLQKPHNRLQIRGVESALRKIGTAAEIKKVHPHRFRRTLATKAIERGMPIEQVQVLLGHAKIDTTLNYAIVNEINVRNSYRQYLE